MSKFTDPYIFASKHDMTMIFYGLTNFKMFFLAASMIFYVRAEISGAFFVTIPE